MTHKTWDIALGLIYSSGTRIKELIGSFDEAFTGRYALPSHSHAGSTYFDPDPGLIVLSPGETASADFAFGTGAGTPATFLEVTPPNALVRLIVRIPGGPAQVVGGRLFVTAMARHTPYNT